VAAAPSACLRLKLLLDEHVSPTVAVELRRRGCDAVAAIEVGLSQRPDADVMSWAVAEGKAIATANFRDFRRLQEMYLSRGERHSGVIFTPRRLSLAAEGFGQLIEALAAFLADHPDDNSLESAEAWLGS